MDYYKFNHTMNILYTTFFNPTGEENPYFYCAYGPKNISITPKDKYQYQWIMIQSIKKHM